jgi:hypothetical protein
MNKPLVLDVTQYVGTGDDEISILHPYLEHVQLIPPKTITVWKQLPLFVICTQYLGKGKAMNIDPKYEHLPLIDLLS